jgi:hypothetical protein
MPGPSQARAFVVIQNDTETRTEPREMSSNYACQACNNNNGSSPLNTVRHIHSSSLARVSYLCLKPCTAKSMTGGMCCIASMEVRYCKLSSRHLDYISLVRAYTTTDKRTGHVVAFELSRGSSGLALADIGDHTEWTRRLAGGTRRPPRAWMMEQKRYLTLDQVAVSDSCLIILSAASLSPTRLRSHLHWPLRLSCGHKLFNTPEADWMPREPHKPTFRAPFNHKRQPTYSRSRSSAAISLKLLSA